MAKLDLNNFEFMLLKNPQGVLDGWRVVMSDGVLTINDTLYEEQPDEPTYDLVRELYKCMYTLEGMHG